MMIEITLTVPLKSSGFIKSFLTLFVTITSFWSLKKKGCHKKGNYFFFPIAEAIIPANPSTTVFIIPDSAPEHSFYHRVIKRRGEA